MSEADEDDARRARARRLREHIEELRRPAGPGGRATSPAPASPREFTDAAAARADEEGKRGVTQEKVPDVEGAPDEAAETKAHEDWSLS
jgi:hypothetical protein